MTYNLNGKNIRIKDAEIARICKGLQVDENEAVKIWLDDEGYTENAEQNTLCAKAKDAKITQTIHGARAFEYDKSKEKTQKERVKKENPTKEMIISEIAQILPNFATDIEIANPGKLITFRVGENTFKLDLVQQRKKK